MKLVYGCLIALYVLLPGSTSGQSQSEPADLSLVTAALKDGTTLQQEQLKGKRFRGDIKVVDVKSEKSDGRTFAVIESEHYYGNGRSVAMEFRTADFETAAQIRVNGRLTVVGTLSYFRLQRSGFMNVSDTLFASFVDTTIKEIKK